MGLLDQLENLAGEAQGQSAGQSAPGQQAAVSQGLLATLAEHEGGVGGLLNQFRQNGMGQHVDSWTNSEPGQGQPQNLSQEQVQQGMGSGMIQQVAQRSGLPEGAVTAALTTILPMVMQHLTPGGQIPQQSQIGGMAQSLLGKFL